MKITIVLAMLLAVSGAFPDSAWSWGSENKDADTKVSETAVETAALDEPSRTSGARQLPQSSVIADIPPSQFRNPLPLEPHSSSSSSGGVQEALLVAAATTSDGNDPAREARFLGIADTLCDWGVGISCDNRIKKKGHGYPPSIPSQYGVPHHYDTYGGQYASAYATDFGAQHIHTKPKGHKGIKKGSTGVSDLISGFLNSYTKPKTDKKAYIPSKLHTYLPPSHPHTDYGVPIYVAKPAYVAPAYVAPKPAYIEHKPAYKPYKPAYAATKPLYAAPKPAYIAPKPAYSAPKPTYVQSSYSSHAVIHQKPKYVHSPVKVATVHTHTVVPVDVTKVQHLHSHTHVYHGAQIIKPGNKGYVTHHTPSFGYDNHFHKKSDNNGNTILSSQGDSFASGTSFVSSSSGTSVGSSFGSGASHVSTNGFTVPLQVSGSTSINHNANPFEAQTFSTGISNSNGFSSHTKFISNNQHTQFQNQNGFQVSAFQPSQSEFGFKPSITIEDMINHNHISQFSRTIYRTDCHCISTQFCSAENIVRGDRDLSHVIDARNNRNVVYSNDTSAENETLAETRTFNISEDASEAIEDTTDYPTYYEYDEYDTENSTLDNNSTAENSTDVPNVVRRRRDVEETEEANFSDVQGRQLTGYTPGSHGCGAGTVCCKRPIYNPARALPVCGISNDENIHGRIKTKYHEAGRAGFGEYPWQAAILRRSAGDLVYVCGATLIDNQYLATAAHCVKDLEMGVLKVRLGEWDTRDKIEFYPHVEFEVSGVYIHPEFYEGNLENDIALIRTLTRVEYSKYPHISPACLPTSGASFTGQVCRITGWGKNAWGSEGEFQAILRETVVPVMDKRICQQVMRTTRLGANYNLHQGMMCAGGEENVDACKGDGGGPLVCQGSSGEFQLAGIVSWGIGCGEKGIPGIYVDVPYYIDWINSIIRA
uniref:Serine proteinase stubble-like n=1 Tax=Hirondellea gigas TaxID=1518452 RepID=A0A6A7G1G7_9CRUS